NFQFEDITNKAGVAGNADWCTGVTMTDVNGDGFLDIYVSVIANKYGLTGHNLLFINNKNNTFSEKAKEYNLDFAGLCTQAAFFDYDHDGDLDCYLLNQSHHPHSNIVDTSNRRKYDPMSGDRLYCNNMADSGRFTDVSAKAGIYQSNLGYGLGLAIADINQDGWEDIYIGNDFHENDYYYINKGDGTFAESGEQHFRHYSRFSMGNDIADYNNDGQPDIVTVDMLPPDEKVLKTYGSDENPDIYKVKLEIQGYQKQYSKNCLQRNNGRGISFSETSLISGVSATDWSWSPLFADFDNDGNKDLFISSGIVKRPVDLDYVRFISDLDMHKGRQQTDAYDEEAISGMPDGSSHPFFFKGDGKLKFEDVSESWGTKDMKGYYNGAAYADLDNDGALDVVINCIDAPAVVLKNKTKKPNQFTVDVKLKGDKANRFGIGAKVWLFSGGRMQYQQLMLTRGFQSSSDAKLHFGLDTLHTIDSILIVWPSQKYQLVKYVPAKELLDFSEIQAGGTFDY
ncbi:MAG TPA: CRTAC1 family protein, partial [Ferruginibacter sp.]|nr:CRTAC1 family protein [Ferruginibacter sp.]